MANVENDELSSSRTETEKTLTGEMTGEMTETFKGDSAVASSFGDDRFCLVEGDPDGSSCQENGLMDEMMDEKISPVVERQLQYLLNKADEIQAELVWSSDFLNDGLAGLISMFLQTSQPYFTYLESTARNSHLQRPPLSIRTQLLQFSQQLSSRLEQLVLMYASFDILSIKETDPARYKRFINHRRFSRRILILPKPKSKIDNMKLSIFRYCCPTPFLASANTRLYKRMRWNVDREEAERYSSTEFYFLCCEDVLEEADANGDEKTATEKESLMMRIWSIGQWIQMYPDPDTDDITDWVLCSVPCGQYKQLLCLGNEEPSSCTATDCLLEVLLSEEIDGTCVTET